MHFLKIKAYRNNFIIYVSFLLTVCIILGVSLCSMVVNDQVQKNENAAAAVSNQIENGIGLLESKIDNYILNLYSSKPLLRDFTCFFGNNAETYLTSRLDSSDGNTQVTSVLSDIQKFVYNNQYAVKEISFQAPSQTNLIDFSESQGISYRFSVPDFAPLARKQDVSFGYVYSKQLMDPKNFSKVMGSVNFVIDVDRIVSGYADYGIGETAVLSENGALYYPDSASPELKGEFREIYAGGNTHGKIRKGLFQTLYYSVYSSKAHGLQLISVVDTGEIFESNRGMFLLIIFGICLIFLIMATVIGAFQARDAKYLNRILVNIGGAKSGVFREIPLGSRKDELRMIANELNEMYRQLNHYIETEYKLKLQQKDTEMKMLQRQVNPHFLYNTLEIIRSCALVNRDEQVADAISNLGGMFRALVKSEDVIPMAQELDILERYLKIMEFKFSGSFFYQIDVDPEIYGLKTVKFWLQPLCENFFVHGYDKSCDFNLLIVRGRAEPGEYVIEVVNNGKSIEPGELEAINRQLQGGTDGLHGKIGLANVCSRLRIFYGGQCSLRVSNNAEAGVCITVRIQKGDADVPALDC